MSGGPGQYESEQGLYDDQRTPGQTSSVVPGHTPRGVVMGSSQSEMSPGNTASSRVPGQQIPQDQLAREQGYPNVTGRSTSGRYSPRTSINIAGNGSTLQPDVDYLNTKLNAATPESLHKLISKFQNKIDFVGFIENISYQGFNRHAFVQSSLVRITVSQFSRLAVMGAIRGSNFKKIKENSLSIDADLVSLFNDGTIVKTPKKKDDISVLRCTASIPQWCAIFMMGANVPPKIVDSQLPAFLQFPAAASIPMSTDLRRQHIDFSIRFSQLIGGAFNPNIYMAAFNNQLPMSEIPDQLRLKLGISSHNESIGVGAQAMITELSTQLIKR